MLHDLLISWFNLVHEWGYSGIVLLMAMESSIFPVPSEIVIPPAAFLAAQGKLNLWGVIAAGTFGSWLGASATYWGARTIGRSMIDRWGRYFFITSDKLDRTELFLRRYEAGGIFFSRLLPVVRHLIGIPAGLVRLNFTLFSIMTVIGSALWCGVLAWFGQSVGQDNPQALQDPDLLMAAFKQSLPKMLVAIAILGLLYLVMMRLTATKSASSDNA